jgi:predicted amidophosphoribosyltransferase
MYYNTPGGAGGSSFDRFSIPNSIYNVCLQCKDKFTRINNLSQICLVCENENLKRRYSKNTIDNLYPGNGPLKPNQSDYGRVPSTAYYNNFDDPTPTGFEN